MPVWRLAVAGALSAYLADPGPMAWTPQQALHVTGWLDGRKVEA